MKPRKDKRDKVIADLIEERDEYYAGYQLLMTRCANLTNLLRDMFPLLNKDLLDERDREMLVSCNDRCLELLGIEKDINDTMPDTDGLKPSEQIEQLARWFKKMGVE